jgi:hypothetical protein
LDRPRTEGCLVNVVGDGRRIWDRTLGYCIGSQAEQPDCLRGSHIRRTIWDGQQELAEIQAPGHTADASQWEQDTGGYSVSNFFRTNDVNRFFGQVVYAFGRVVDQPVSDVPTGERSNSARS